MSHTAIVTFALQPFFLHVGKFVIVVASMVDDFVETTLQTQPDPIDLFVIVVIVCLLNVLDDFADVLWGRFLVEGLQSPKKPRSLMLQSGELAG